MTGTPVLKLNDGGTASYTGGSGTSALTFAYLVAAGDNTPDLTVTGLVLNCWCDDCGRGGKQCGSVRRGEEPGRHPQDRHHRADR